MTETAASEFHRSLALYNLVLARPETDRRTRVVCLAKKASLLDKHPPIRTFDATCRMMIGPCVAAAKTPPQAPASLNTLLADRVATIRDLAAAYKENGDAVNAAVSYDRAVRLLEALPQESRQMCIVSRADALAQWADVEQSLGRTTMAARIRDKLAAD